MFLFISVKFVPPARVVFQPFGKPGIDGMIPFNAFFEIEDDCFELYYTAEARALDNKLAVSELPAPKKCWIHYQAGGGGGIVHIRKIAPQTIEYTVMTAEGTTVAPVEKCELG